MAFLRFKVNAVAGLPAQIHANWGTSKDKLLILCYNKNLSEGAYHAQLFFEL